MHLWRLTLDQVLDMTIDQVLWHEEQSETIQKALHPPPK